MYVERTGRRDSPQFTGASSDRARRDILMVERLQSLLGDHYEVLGAVGEGPVGIVFRVRARGDRQAVALKLLAVDPELALAAYQRGKQAALVAATVDHPRAVVPRVADPVAGTVFLTIPLFERSVEDVLAARTSLPFDQVVAILTDAAVVLDRAHSRGIVHGGLKPSNILLDAEGRALVSDFGVGQIFGTKAGGAAGAYLAPEQWRGQGANAHTDQYALAVIAYELITGERRAGAAQVEGIPVLEPLEVSGFVPLRHGLDMHANAVLRTALSASAANRFASTREFVDALAGRIPIDAHASLTAHEDVKLVRKRHVFGAVLVGGVFLAGLSLLDNDVQRGFSNDLRALRRRVDVANRSLDVRVPAAPPRAVGGAIHGSNATAGAVSRGGSTRDPPGRLTSSGGTIALTGGAIPTRAEGGGSAGTSGALRPYYSGPGTLGGAAIVGRTTAALAPSTTMSSPGSVRTASPLVGARSASRMVSAAQASVDRVVRTFSNGSVQSPSDAPAAVRLPSAGHSSELSSASTPSVRASSAPPARETSVRPSAAGLLSGAIRVSTVGGTGAVVIDGIPRGTSPTVVRVSPGAHQVEVEAPGATYMPARRRVTVAKGDTVTLEFMRVAAPR